MSLEGAKFICIDEAGNHGEIVLAKGRKFTMGYYVSCDFVLVDERAKGVHCEIECDAFGRVTIRNFSPDKPILVNGSTVEIKRILLNNSKLTILDKEYLWIFPKVSSNEFEDLPVEAASTPQKQICMPEQAPNSCPDFKLHREMPKRFTVHNFAYCIQSDEEGNTSSDSNNENDNEQQDTPTNENQNVLETQIKQDKTTDYQENITQEKDTENRNRSVTPEPTDSNEKSTGALMETPKMDLINCTKNKENKSTQKKHKQLLTMCHQSDVLITSFKPRETGVSIEKSFATIIKPKVLVTKTPATPKSVYSTPQSDFNEILREQEDDERELMTFHTPSTPKEGTASTSSMSAAFSKVLKNSSMHLIDLTTPNKLRPASPYLKSALKASALKNMTQIAAVDKACSKLSAHEQLGLSALPSTPALTDASNSPSETPSSVISVNSSTDTSSIIEVTSDGSNIGITPGSVTGVKTPIKTLNRMVACTPKRTPQSLMKRALLTSAKKQNITQQRTANTVTTPRRESINRIPLRSNLALLRTPVTPQASTGDKSTSQLPRRISISTPTRKSTQARSRFDMSPSSSNLASSPSTSNKTVTRRSSINPISAARALTTSTPVSASSNNSGLRTRAACKTSPLHKVRKSIGGVSLSSHISKTRRSIVQPASTSKITSIKDKSPQQVMSDRLISKARKSLCLTPISARSRNMATAAKTPPQQSDPSSILKARTTQSARKPERKALLFADEQPAVDGETHDLSRTFIIDSDEEVNADKKKGKQKDATFSPEKETAQQSVVKNDKNEGEKEGLESLEIPVDVEEITDLIQKNNEPDNKEQVIKTCNEKEIAAYEEKNGIEEETPVTEIEAQNTKNIVAQSVTDKGKSIVTEESFAEIVNDSQEINKENLEISDSPKKSSETESQEIFADALHEIVKQNIKQTEINLTNTTADPLDTITQVHSDKTEVLESGFGEESIVEILETSNRENILNGGAKYEEETTSNTENKNKTELKNQVLTENQTEEQTNSQEKENEPSEKDVVQCETINEETKCLDAQIVEDKVELKVDEQKTCEYKPIVEDITLEGSLLEKETKESEDTIISKQPLYKDITLERSLIEEKFKTEEIKGETKTADNSENQIMQDKHIPIAEDNSNISHTPTVKETRNVEDVIELSEANTDNEETLDENLPTSTPIFEEDDDNTNKLLEEIEDVLNKSDEIKQKHLLEMEEGKQQIEKPLTEEFESEKLTQEKLENIEETTCSSKDVTNVTKKHLQQPENNISNNNKVQQSSDLETSQQETGTTIQKEINNSKEIVRLEKEQNTLTDESPKLEASQQNVKNLDKEDQIDNECKEETEAPTQEETFKSTENVHEQTEHNILTDEMSVLSIQNHSEVEATKLETEIVLQNKENVEPLESNVAQHEMKTLKEEKDESRETFEIKETITLNQCDDVTSSETLDSEHAEITLKESKTELCAQDRSDAKESAIIVLNEENIKNKTSNSEQIELCIQKDSEAIISEIIDQNEENAEEHDDNESKIIKNENNADELEAKESECIQYEKNNKDVDSLIESHEQETISSEHIILQTEDFEEENTALSTIETIDIETAAQKQEKSETLQVATPIQSEESKSSENIVSQTRDNTLSEENENVGIFQNEQSIQEETLVVEASSQVQKTKSSSDETVNVTISQSAANSDQKETENVEEQSALTEKLIQDPCTASSDKTVIDPFSQSNTDCEKSLTEIAINLQQTVESQELKKELISISSIKQRIENASSFTPKRTRRTSLSTQTPQTTATELSFTPRRSTRRASQSAETPQSTTTELSFTPRRSTRRASMSAEITSTATPTRRTTRCASLSVVSETPLTPKAINKRRASISMDAETPSTSKTPRKQFKQRMAIPEEVEEVTDAFVIKEDEEPAESAVIQAQMDDVKNVIIEEVKTRENKENKNEPAEDTLTTEVINLDEKQPVALEILETQETIDTIVLDTEEEPENIEKLTTQKSDDILSPDEKEVADIVEKEVTLVSEQTPDVKENISTKDAIALEEKTNDVQTFEQEDISVKEVINTIDIVNSEENEEVSIIAPEKSSDDIMEELIDTSKPDDEVDKVAVKDDSSTIAETSEEQDNNAKSSEILQEKDSSETSKLTDLNSSQKSADDNIEEEMEDLKFVDDVEIPPTKAATEISANVEENLISTPVPKKSVKILADSPKTPLMAGMRELLKTPKAEIQTPRLEGIRDLVRTPRVKPECEEVEIEKLAAVAELVKTPKAKKQVTIVADSPKTPLRTGMRVLLKTPIADNNTPKLMGIRNLVRTPKYKIENEQEESEKLAVVAELVRTPQKSSTVTEEMPSTSIKHDNLKGVKELLKTPKSCSTPRFKGMRELMQTPKTSTTPVMAGVKQLLESPVLQNKVTEEIVENAEINFQPATEEIPTTTAKNIVKDLLKTPKGCRTPRLRGIRELMQTPKISSTPIMDGIKELMDYPAEQKDNELEKFLRTPTAKNIMIPTMPSSAVIEKSSDSIEISTEYDLNASHVGESANLEELFKTPLASRFVERITDSYYGEEGEGHDETVEKFNHTQSGSLQDTLNKSAEEAFDKLVGQETQMQTPISKIYKRKSFALNTPQAQSPFTAADVLSDLPKSDVQEWVETLDQAEPPTLLECNDMDENVVEPNILNESVSENEEISGLEYTLGQQNAQNISANDSIIPETCTKIYLTENSLTNIATSSLSNIATKDPLLSTTSKPKKNVIRPLTPVEADISGINMLDQTIESVQDEPSMLDEPLLVEEPSMFEEHLMVSDNESEAENTHNNGDMIEVSHYEANDLSEPLLLSDSEELNQYQEIETNELEVKADENEILHTTNVEVNTEEKYMLANVLEQSLVEDPLETKDKVPEVSLITDQSIIDTEASKIEDESNGEDSSSNVTVLLAVDPILPIEDSPIKESFTTNIVPCTSKISVTETVTLIHSENELDAEVDAAETTVEEEQKQIDAEIVQGTNEKMSEVNNQNTDAKEISIKETKVRSNKSEDIFLDTSVIEIFEETNENQVDTMEMCETKKHKIKATSQELEHECQDIFMDNSNIDESFGDEATNEENDVENESAMVEVTTKEVTKHQSENIAFTMDAANKSETEIRTNDVVASNDEKTVKDNEEVLEKETDCRSKNVQGTENVKIVEENTEDLQFVEKTESLELITSFSEMELTQTISKETSGNEIDKPEFKANVADEPSSLVWEELENSQIEKQMELMELPNQIEAKPSDTSVISHESLDEKQIESTSNIADEHYSFVTKELESSQIEDTAEEQKEFTDIETKPSETSVKQTEFLNEKQVETRPSETLEIKQEETSDETAKQITDIKLSETNEEQITQNAEIFTESSTEQEEELKDLSVATSAEAIENETKENVNQDSALADDISNEDKVTSKVPQSADEIVNEAESISQSELQESETIEETTEEPTTELKESETSEIITHNSVPIAIDYAELSIKVDVTIEKDQIESEIPSETALTETFRSSESAPTELAETSEDKDETKTVDSKTYATEERDLLNTGEEALSTMEEAKHTQEVCEEKSHSISTLQEVFITEKLAKTTSEITESSEIITSYDYEIKISDTEQQKETDAETMDDKSEKQSTADISNADLEMPTTRRTRRNAKTKEHTKEITSQTEKDSQELTKQETDAEASVVKDLENPEATAVNSKETGKITAMQVSEMSEDSQAKETEVIAIKTKRNKRTTSESSQDSTQGEESHYRSRRDKRKVIKKTTAEKLAEVKEEIVEQHQISKYDLGIEDVKLKRKHTTSESSQASLQDDDHPSSNRRAHRKVQKTPVEETVIELTEDYVDLAAEQLTQPEEQTKETKKQRQELNLDAAEDIAAITNKASAEELVVEGDEEIVELSTENQEPVSSKEEQMEEIEVLPIKEENESKGTEDSEPPKETVAETHNKEEIEELSKTDDKLNVQKENTAKTSDTDNVEEQKTQDVPTEKQEQVILPEMPTISSALEEEQNLNVNARQEEETLPTTPNKQVSVEPTSDIPESCQGSVQEINEVAKLPGIIKMPETDEVMLTVQENVQGFEENVAIVVENTKEQPVKRGRRKPTVSESSQGSIQEDDNSRSRKTRRKVQKTPVEEVVVEESIVSENVAASFTRTEEISITENKKDLNTKEAEAESKLAVTIQQKEPTDSKLADEKTVEVQSVTLEEVKEQTTKRSRRKPAVSESSQGLVNEDEYSRSRRGRRQVQKTSVENIVLEENEDQITKQLEMSAEIKGEKEEVSAKSTDLNQETEESLNKNSENITESAVIDLQEDKADYSLQSKQDLVLDAFSLESAQADNKESNDTKELPQVLTKKGETQEPAQETHVEREDAKQHGVKRGRRKRDLTKNVSEEPTTSRNGRRKVQVLATAVTPIESISEHKNEPVEAEVVLSENKPSEIEDIKHDQIVAEKAVEGRDETVNLPEVLSQENWEVKQETTDNLPELVSTQEKHDEETNEDSVKQQEDTTTKQTAKRGGRRKIYMEEVPVKASANVKDTILAGNEITTSHTTKRGGRHKTAASETTTAEVAKVRSTSRNPKAPVEHSTTSETELTEINENKIEEIYKMPTAEGVEVPKGRTASQTPKTPVEHPTTSTQQEKQIESTKVVKEIAAVAEIPKGRTTSRNRKTPIEQPTTATQQELPTINNEKQIEVSENILEIPSEIEKPKTVKIITLDDSTDEDVPVENKHKKEVEDKSVKKRVKRTRAASETNQLSVVDEKPSKRRARHQVAETEEDHVADVKTNDIKTTELQEEENIEEVHTNEEFAVKPQKPTRRRGAAATHQDHDEEHHQQTSTKPRRRRVRHEEIEEHQHSENVEEPQKPSEEALLSEVQITEVSLEPEELLDQLNTPQEENQKDIKVRKGRRKAADDEHDQEAHETLAPTKRRLVAKHIEHDHEESGTSSKRRAGKRTEKDALDAHSESSETVSKRRNIGKDQQEHEKVENQEDHHAVVIVSEESIQRDVDREKHDHEPEHSYHEIETQHPQEEAKKGKGRRKKNEHSEESEQPSTSHSPETKPRGRKRKQSQTGAQEHILNEENNTDENLPKEPETKQVNPIAELQTPQRAASVARRGRKASTIEHITAESQEMLDTPGRRARNVPQRRAATAYHNYDETSDSEVSTKTKKKTDSPRKSLEASKTLPTVTITSAPIINPSTSPSSTTPATTARGRTRKPTAKVQQFLEEERAKAETPKKRGLLAAVAGTDTATPQRTPAKRGRKASTIDTEVERTPQASKGRGRGKLAIAHTKEDLSVVVPEITSASVVEVKEIELHTTPPPAQPAKGRRGGRKAKITEEEHHKDDEPPAKKSSLELESEKQDSTPSADSSAPTPPTRVAGRRNAAAAAKARIEEDALAAAAADPPKRARAKKAPAKVSIAVVATTDTDAPSSEVEEEKGAKNKNSPQKHDHRLASSSTIEGAKALEDEIETETMDKPANKKVRKAATATTDTTVAVPAKRGRKPKVVEEVADTETPGEPKTARVRGRGRKNVHFDEQQEALATTSTATTNTVDNEPTVAETPEPGKKGTRTRRK